MSKRQQPATAETEAEPKRPKLTNGSTVWDYVRYHDGRVRRSINGFLHDRTPIYVIPDEVFQHHTLDLINRVVSRMENGLPIASLDLDSVIVEDNAVSIPKLGSGPENFQYGGKVKGFAAQLFGQSGSWEERDDFLKKLDTTNLSREQLIALHFHILVKNQEQRSMMPVEFVDKFKHRLVKYNNAMVIWTTAYNSWETTFYPPQGKIDLLAACSKYQYALKVYWHKFKQASKNPKKHKVYNDTPASRIRLARNILVHINDYLKKDGKPLLTLYQRGRLVEELFPGLGLRLFNFMWYLEIDCDFLKSRNYFKPLRLSQ